MKTSLALLLALASPLHAGDPVVTPSELLVARYEVVRAALATDDHAAALRAAVELKAAAETGESEVTAPVAARFRNVAEAAGQLATSRDIAGARTSFSAVSREIVSLVASDTSLQDGRSLLSCPMVEGYGEWVQRSGTTSNPYWGRSMLTCGSSKTWD